MDNKNASLVLSERQSSILRLTLNRPDKSNSLHPDLVGELSNALHKAKADPDLSVVVLTGAGNSFCAGLDLSLLAGWTSVQKLEYLDEVVAVFWQIWLLPQPVIAAVNGAAIAGGFDLAAFCDIRLAAPEAVFGQAEINLGLIQVIHPLYKSIGLGVAKEMAMTGKNITAEEGYRIGLVNHIYPRNELLNRAMELAEILASKPRHALFETKRLTRELIDLDTAAALAEIRRSFKACVESEEHEKRVADVYSRLRERTRRD